jgi:hypothetical protein
MTNEEKQRTREVLTQLKNEGYTGVSISFDGAGDSGSITGAKAFTFTGDFILEDRYHEDFWQYEPEITEDLKNLGYEILSESGYDWYNNDGGYGSIHISLLTGEINLDIKIRISETEDYLITSEVKNYTR